MAVRPASVRSGLRAGVAADSRVPALTELERLVADSGSRGTPVIALEPTGSLHRALARRSSSGAFPVRCASARAVRDRRPRAPARLTPLQDRRPRLRGADLARRARALGAARTTPAVRGAAGRGAPSPPARRRAAAAAPAPARPAERALPRPLGAGRARPRAAARLADRAGGARLRGRLRRPRAERPLAQGPRPGPADRRDDARFWAERWRACCRHLPTPSCAPERLGRDLERFRALEHDVAELDAADRARCSRHARARC